MAKILNPKKWIWLPLLSAGFALILFVRTGHAAQLNDIRVGEYEDFTRIVFELDTPAEPEKIEIRSTTQLAVIFKNTSANLIRKIPVDRSPHVDNIQIWEKGNQLTALLAFNFENFGHKSFSLTDPPRLVLDIHPSSIVPDTGAGASLDVTPEKKSGSFQTEATGDAEPAPQPNEKAFSEKSAPQPPEPSTGDAHKAPAAVVRDRSPATPPVPAARTSGRRPGRLQFYLVIALVVITIVILALLFLMLLARHRWIGVKSHLTAAEDPEATQKL